MTFNEYARQFPLDPESPSAKYGLREVLPRITCADGFSFSVQVGSHAYCSPRVNDSDFYSEVEVGFPSEKVESLMSYAEQPEKPTETVYGYVPVEVVDAVIEQHGGITP